MAGRGAIAALALVLVAGAQMPNPPEVRLGAHAYLLPPLQFQARADRVEVEVVVRQPNGAVLAGLDRSRFTIFDNGQARPVTDFSVATAPPPPPTPYAHAATATAAPPPGQAAAPRSIALYFDDVNTDKGDLNNARNAAERFVKEALAPEDRVAIFTASSEQSLGETSDHARLLAAVAAIRTHPRASDSLQPCPRITAYQAYLMMVVHDPMALTAAQDEYKKCPENTATDEFSGKPMTELSLNDRANEEPILAQAQATWNQAEAVSFDTLRAVRGVVEYLANQPGSRMLLMASGGFLAGSGTLQGEQDRITQEALRANVVINTLDAKGLYTDGPGRPLNEAMDVGTLPLATFFFEETAKMSMRQEQNSAMVQLAQNTGGLFFHDSNDLTLGFYRLGLMPEVTYQLAFAPGNIPHDGKYHKLTVKLAAAGHDIIQARRGYFAPAAVADAATLQQQLDSAMHDQATPADLAVRVAVKPGRGSATVAVRLDPSRLPFADSQGRHRLQVRLIVGLFNPQGRFIAGKEGEMDMALTDATLKRLEAQGLGANLTVTAPKGDYRLRIVLGDSASQLFAGNERVQVQ